MEAATSAEIEEAAVEAISKVVPVSRCERLDDRRPGKTPDWRLTLGDGRVADVEVTRAVDQAEAGLLAAAHTKDGSPKEWCSERLSYRWTVMMRDCEPTLNRKRRPLKQAVRTVIPHLAEIESERRTA